MLCFRCLWLVSLTFTIAAAPVRAQQPGSGPPQRTVTFRFDRQMETEVADLYLAPGSSTTVHMPVPIREGGYALKGGQGRITAMQPPSSPNVLVLLASGRPGPERIPLFVSTVDGRRYPFVLATVPGVMDSEVRVVSWNEETRGQRPLGDPMMEVLLQGKEIAVRSFKRNKVDDPVFLPWVEKTVRQGDRLYLRIRRDRKTGDRPWEVKTAVLLGPQGELLKVVDVQWSEEAGERDINVILAELPDAAPNGFSLTSIQLRGKDGVDIQLDGTGVLP